MIHIVLPYHLRNLAHLEGDAEVEVASTPVTIGAVLDAIEAKYPMLCGTIRDHDSGKRRDFLRYFASGQDLSHEPPSTPLPDAIVSGDEPFIVLGAIAGG